MKIVRNGVLMIMSLMVAIGLSELILRLASVSYPVFHERSVATGIKLRAGVEGWFRKEGEAYIRINSDGLRDVEHNIAKKEGVIRIAVLGDSYAEALQLPLQDSFSQVMQRNLSDCEVLSESKIEVINFGVSSYGTAHEYLTLKEKVWKYDPDLILLAFLPGNDIKNNSEALQGDAESPYFTIENGNLVFDDSYKEHPNFKAKTSWLGQATYFVIQYSRIAQLVNYVRAESRQKAWLKNQAKKKSVMKESLRQEEVGLDDAVFVEPPSEDWEKAWDVTEALIVEIYKNVKDHDAKFLLASLSSGTQVHPDVNVRMSYRERLGVDDLYYAENRLANLASEKGMPYLPIAPALADWAAREGRCVHGFPNSVPCAGHWNGDGHRVAGRLLADKVCKVFSDSSHSPGISAAGERSHEMEVLTVGGALR